MDNIDRKILHELSENSRLTASEISRRVNLSIPAVSERIRKLEEHGIIEKYTIRINRRALDYKLMAIIFVNIDMTEHIDGFRKTIISYTEVLECHHLAGPYDYMLKVLVCDTEELESFISHKLKRIEGVVQSNTLINLSTLKWEVNRQEAVE